MKLSTLFASFTLTAALFACSTSPSEAPGAQPPMSRVVPASLMQMPLPVSLTIDIEDDETNLAAKRCVCTKTGHSFANCSQPSCNNLCMHSNQGTGVCL